jgi:von Willebrand factor type A domain-containing protein
MLIPNPRSLAVALPAALLAMLAVSCGGSDGSSVDGGNGNGTTANGSGAQPGELGSGSNGTGAGSGTVTTITPGSECAKGSAAANAIPAVVEMVIDISQSMTLGADGSMRPARGMSKWDITSAALKDAVSKLPASIAVGINFFPNNPMRNSCINNRVDLPIALLDAANSMQRRAFDQAIDRANPNNGTPTHAAFEFGLQTVQASTLSGRKFVLLITDGKPTYNLDCSGDGMSGVENAPLIAAVDTAFKDAKSVSTFVIGSPGSEDARADLSQMATKGGTAKAGCSDAGPNYCHLDMATAADFGAALSSGLAEIAGQIGTCEYAVPAAPAGQTIDPLLVNVLYTKADGTQATIPQDAEGSCASGWQYDNPGNPSKILLCGSDCDAVKADQGAKIDVIFGCTRQTNVPVK